MHQREVQQTDLGSTKSEAPPRPRIASTRGELGSALSRDGRYFHFYGWFESRRPFRLKAASYITAYFSAS